MDTEDLMLNALIYLTAAVIAVPLFKRLGLGSILGYLCAGVVLGPNVLAVISEPEQVLHFAEYGVILLLFIIGLELAPDKLWAMRGQISLIGGNQLILSALLIGGLYYWIIPNSAQSIILGLTLGLSSTAFAVQLMSEERMLATPLGRKGFSVLLLQDMAVIPILLLVDLLAQSQGSNADSIPWYLGVLAVITVLLFSQYGLNTVLRIIARTNTRELMTAASLLIVISVAMLMEKLGLSMGLGAFLAGIMLANSDYRHQLESDIEPFKGILLGLFFIAVGMTLNIELLLDMPLLMIGGALLLIAIKSLVIVAVLRWRHVSFRESFQLGLMLSQGGEFAFVILSQATRVELFPLAMSEQITLIVGLSMAFTSPLVVLHRRLWNSRSEAQPDQDGHWDSHEPEVIIAGFGRFGQVIGRLLAANSIPFTAMDKDPVHVEFVKQFGNRLFYGNLTRLDVLKAAGVKHAKILVVAVNDIKESLEIVDIAQRENPRLQIVARAINREHAYELHARNVGSVTRETFASSVEAASDTLVGLGYPEGEALQLAELFRKHDEAMLLRSVEHKDDLPQLLNLSKQGRRELAQLFSEDRNETA